MFRPTSQFDKLLDKATSNLRLEPDWPTIIQICDFIRQGDVQPKYAVSAIKKKLVSGNPHVAMFSLQVLESCVKNCGSLIQEEVGTKSCMEHLREVIKNTTHENVKNKVLELLQTWAFAFRNSPKYRAVQDTVNIMKAEGYKFPVLKESDAMFLADTAPEWADGECCHRCRVQFGMVQRKHHCRACGQVFCGQCSSKTCTLPKFGIEREVRVCEACYEKVNKPTASTKSEDLPVEYLTSSLAQQSQAPPPRKSEAELREEEELQLALALSQSEAEHKTKIHTSPMATTARAKTHSPPPVVNNSPENDPELARYLNRSYWQQQSAEHNSPSAPVSASTNKQSIPLQQNGVEEEMDEFAHALQSQVEIFVNRMKSNSSRGRSIANDSSVQTLFMTITAMHSKLLRYIQHQDDSRVYYEGLQDRLTQVKDARAALDALREEHKEKLRREAELAERQRQLQMAQKLDIMRKKKQEYLQYQRQLALQRIQEQEREMQMRQEQQKQQYLLGSYANIHYLPPGYDNAPRYPPAPMPQAPGFPPYQPGAPLPPSGPPPVMGMGQEYMGTVPRVMMGGGPGGPQQQQPPPMVMMGPAPQLMGPMAPPMGQVMAPPPPPPQQTALPQIGSPTISAPQLAPPPQHIMLPPQQQQQQQPPPPPPQHQPQHQPLGQQPQPKDEDTAELISFD